MNEPKQTTRKRFTSEEISEVWRLHAEGLPQSVIAERMGVSQGCICNTLKRIAANNMLPAENVKPDATTTRKEYATITIGNKLLKHLPDLSDGEACFLALHCPDETKAILAMIGA